jgi:hypothetical protein
MAVIGHLFITEYAQIGQAAMDAIQAPMAPPLKEQRLEIHDDVSTPSEPFDGGTRFVVISATCPCWLSWKEPHSPTAVPGYHPLMSERTYGVMPRTRVAVHGGTLA